MHLADLLHRSLVLDPSKRIGVVDAIKHPFFTAKDGS
jgi:serine/threonine protein kinase